MTSSSDISLRYVSGPKARATRVMRTGTYWPIALYMLVLALITLVALAFGPETYRREMSEEEVMKESVGPQQASSAQGRR